jgi:hypothetical protein
MGIFLSASHLRVVVTNADTASIAAGINYGSFSSLTVLLTSVAVSALAAAAADVEGVF